jgi:hypothetical protein
MTENQLVLKALRENDRLISNENEIFEVDKSLGKNILCCENELAFRLKSIDRRNKEIIVLGQLDSYAKLHLTGFKKHRPLN